MKFPHLESLARRVPPYKGKRSPQPRAPIPFLELPKNKRSDAVIRLRNEMRWQLNKYGGRFVGGGLTLPISNDNIQLFDFRFPGKNRFTIWNAELRAARLVFLDEVSAMAWERALSMLTIEEQDFFTDYFEIFSTKKGKKFHHSRTMMARPKQFNGHTFNEQIAIFEDEITLNHRPPIHESFNIERHRHENGIGLQITLDIEEINIGDVEDVIDRFISLGEREWISTNPVPTERLPATAPYKSFPHMEAGIDKTPITESKILEIEKLSRNSPLIFSIKNIRLGIHIFWDDHKVWMADLEFIQPNDFIQSTFEDVLFLEHDGKLFFHDFQGENDHHLVLHSEVAPKQDRFLHFLQNENRNCLEKQDLNSLIRIGQKQLTSGKGTPAKIYRQDPSPVLAFAYQDNTGRYEIVIPDLEAI